MKKHLTVLPLFLVSIANSTLAQQVPGLAISNYGGLYRATQNPATLGGSRYKWQINLITIGSTVNNRYFYYWGKNSFLYPQLVPHSTDELYGRSRTMGSISQGDPLHVASEIRLPSVMFSVGKSHGFAVQLRSRGFVYGNNLPKDLRRMYFKRLDTPDTPTGAGEWGDFDLGQQSFSEASFSYGLQLVNWRSHKLKVGATAKYIFGARANYLKASADRYEISPMPGGETDEKQLILNNLAYESGYTYPNAPWKLSELTNATKYGSGWAYDLGATYELGSYWHHLETDDDARPGYLLRFSASVTDLGVIRYESPDGRVLSGSQSRTVIGQKELEIIADRGAQGFAEVLPGSSETMLARDARLPAALHWDVDVQLVKSFFLNVAKNKRYGVAPESPIDMTQPDALIITPRFENEDSDFSLPLTFIEGNNKVMLGALARFGPIHVGFSNIGGFLNRKNPDAQRATYLYAGFSVWKFKARK
ncbi:DUF5723 family protein [Persicitalea sp.]|uniref:DUF5723 family protein n=1 Tax=Persicitalea sp. TaxID=3100273 RepID=UPI00359314B6